MSFSSVHYPKILHKEYNSLNKEDADKLKDVTENCDETENVGYRIEGKPEQAVKLRMVLDLDSGHHCILINSLPCTEVQSQMHLALVAESDYESFLKNKSTENFKNTYVTWCGDKDLERVARYENIFIPEGERRRYVIDQECIYKPRTLVTLVKKGQTILKLNECLKRSTTAATFSKATTHTVTSSSSRSQPEMPTKIQTDTATESKLTEDEYNKTLTHEERIFYTTCTKYSDFTNPHFQNWLDKFDLWKHLDEDEIAFGKRVLGFIIEEISYSEKESFRACSWGNVINGINNKETDDCGFVIIFNSILRANDIPARTKIGIWCHEGYECKSHVAAEMFCEKIGWIHVECTEKFSTLFGDDHTIPFLTLQLEMDFRIDFSKVLEFPKEMEEIAKQNALQFMNYFHKRDFPKLRYMLHDQIFDGELERMTIYLENFQTLDSSIIMDSIVLPEFQNGYQLLVKIPIDRGLNVFIWVKAIEGNEFNCIEGLYIVDGDIPPAEEGQVVSKNNYYFPYMISGLHWHNGTVKKAGEFSCSSIQYVKSIPHDE